MVPNYIDAHYYLALVYLALHENKKAQASVDEVLKRDPAHAGAIELEGKCCQGGQLQ